MKLTGFLVGSFFLIFIFLFFIFIYKPNETFNCRRNRHNLSKEFCGIVIDVEENSWNHQNEVIRLKSQIFEFQDNWFEKSLINTVQVGDSICKEENSLIIKIYRNNTMNYFNLELPCIK